MLRTRAARFLPSLCAFCLAFRSERFSLEVSGGDGSKSATFKNFLVRALNRPSDINASSASLLFCSLFGLGGLDEAVPLEKVAE